MNHTDAHADATCPTQETLAALLAASGALPAELIGEWSRSVVTDDEMRAFSAHIAACDRCVEELRVASNRLALAADIPMPVPSEVVARVVATRPRLQVAPAQKTAVVTRMRDWLASTGRLPVLVPMALAALALIVIVPRLQTPTGSQDELSRAVDLRQVARVTVDTAAVRAARDSNATVLTTLVRGDRAVLVGEQDGWYRVVLGDGNEGWIERTAFD